MTTAPAHRRGAAVDERVLTTTLTLLAEQGYDFTVDQVASRADVHKTTIYRRWATKPALVAAAVEKLSEHSVVVETGEDPVASLDALAVSVAQALRRPAGVNALRAALAAAGSDPELRATADRFLRSRYELATPLIEAAQASGRIRADVDATLIWQAIVNPLHLNAVTGARVDDDMARDLLRLVLSSSETTSPEDAGS